MLFSLPPFSPGADQIERRLDNVRSVCHLAQKRLIACLQGQHGTDPDKRHVSTAVCALSSHPAAPAGGAKLCQTSSGETPAAIPHPTQQHSLGTPQQCQGTSCPCKLLSAWSSCDTQLGEETLQL